MSGEDPKPGLHRRNCHRGWYPFAALVRAPGRIGAAEVKNVPLAPGRKQSRILVGCFTAGND